MLGQARAHIQLLLLFARAAALAHLEALVRQHRRERLELVRLLAVEALRKGGGRGVESLVQARGEFGYEEELWGAYEWGERIDASVSSRWWDFSRSIC